MRKLWKIHIGLIIGFLISFISGLILIIASDKEITIFLPMALFFTYEYLIINFLKDDFLTKEFKERAKYEYSEDKYRSIVIYRGIVKFALCVCILLAPIMWGMAIITI
ncbi:MAG: hypothetical protein ACI4F2_04600 [Acutalibacteraceae bacterium]